MNVNSLYVILIFFPFLSFSQQKKVFILEKDSPEYAYYVDGNYEKDLIKGDPNIIYITSKEDYEKNKATTDQHVVGEPRPLDGITFTVKGKNIFNCEDLDDYDLVNYEWLVKNKKIIVDSAVILNTFKNMYLAFKNDKNCILYNVIRQFNEY